MKKITIKELKEIQLQILDDVMTFCDRENLMCFLAYGTLLGAVRHKGYIPWDDDIDLAMPRKDYDYFMKNYNSSRYRFVDYELDSSYLYSFGKVMDTETKLVEHCHIPYDLGVNIDIFPLDVVDEEGKLLRKTKMLRKLIFFKTMPWNQRRGVFKNIVLSLGRIVLSVMPLKILIRQIIKCSKSMEGKETNKLSIPVESAYNTYAWDKKWFEKALYCEFENRQCKIPVGYHAWLTELYGDYMQVPPESKRESLHEIEAYWR